MPSGLGQAQRCLKVNIIVFKCDFRVLHPQLSVAAVSRIPKRNKGEILESFSIAGNTTVCSHGGEEGKGGETSP